MEQYERWRRVLDGVRLPAAVMDLDAVDHNLTALTAAMAPEGATAEATLRIATKSVRCPWLLRYLLHRGAPHTRGLMTYTVRETELLAELGFDDLLLAYPVGRQADALVALTGQGKRVIAVVDCDEHIATLNAAAEQHGVEQSVLIDVDVSWRPGGSLHLGVHRSPVRDADAALALAQKVVSAPHLDFAGVLAYEAQIAGVQDHSRSGKALDPVRRLVKSRSLPFVAERRRSVLEALQRADIPVQIVNGGGTGSIRATVRDPTINEVTAGSGFVCPHLFDGYDDLPLQPAAFFAIEVVRHSDPAHVTCAQGGWIASGSAGADRSPIVHLPDGLQPRNVEGWGEVQTPFRNRGDTLAIGDPVICRHAKAGELFDHFGQVLMVRGDEIVERVVTYRGLGL